LVREADELKSNSGNNNQGCTGWQSRGLMRPFKLIRICKRKRYNGKERRRKPRIYYPIPIKVRTRGGCGERVEFDIFANDLSAGGFSAYAANECKPGQKLFFIIRFSSSGKDLQATTVAAQGIVLRSEKRKNGSYVFASTMERRRII
jgi:hypothetical protein